MYSVDIHDQFDIGTTLVSANDVLMRCFVWRWQTPRCALCEPATTSVSWRKRYGRLQAATWSWRRNWDALVTSWLQRRDSVKRARQNSVWPTPSCSARSACRNTPRTSWSDWRSARCRCGSTPPPTCSTSSCWWTSSSPRSASPAASTAACLAVPSLSCPPRRRHHCRPARLSCRSRRPRRPPSLHFCLTSPAHRQSSCLAASLRGRDPVFQVYRVRRWKIESVSLFWYQEHSWVQSACLAWGDRVSTDSHYHAAEWCLLPVQWLTRAVDTVYNVQPHWRRP